MPAMSARLRTVDTIKRTPERQWLAELISIRAECANRLQAANAAVRATISEWASYEEKIADAEAAVETARENEAAAKVDLALGRVPKPAKTVKAAKAMLEEIQENFTSTTAAKEILKRQVAACETRLQTAKEDVVNAACEVIAADKTLPTRFAAVAKEYHTLNRLVMQEMASLFPDSVNVFYPDFDYISKWREVGKSLENDADVPLPSLPGRRLLHAGCALLPAREFKSPQVPGAHAITHRQGLGSGSPRFQSAKTRAEAKLNRIVAGFFVLSRRLKSVA